MNNLPKRKQNRLNHYDYSQNGAYFITICTIDRKPLLSRITVGAHIVRPPITELSNYGEIVKEKINNIPLHYDNVLIDNYVIMPNHIHLIINITENGRTMCAPTISRIIKHFKESVTKSIGCCIWQKGFYDHIIRDEEDYLTKCQYIENNPTKWLEDELYIKS